MLKFHFVWLIQFFDFDTQSMEGGSRKQLLNFQRQMIILCKNKSPFCKFPTFSETTLYNKCKYKDLHSFKSEGRRVRRAAKDTKKKVQSNKKGQQKNCKR